MNKFTAFLTAACTAISVAAAALFLCAVPVSAAGKSTVRNIQKEKTYTDYLENKDDSLEYRLSVGSDGILTLKFTAYMSTLTVAVADNDGNLIEPSAVRTAKGQYFVGMFAADRSETICRAVCEYTVGKGYYTVAFTRGYGNEGSGRFSFSAAASRFKAKRTDNNSGSISASSSQNRSVRSVKIQPEETAGKFSTDFIIYVEKGDSVQLGSVTDGRKDDSVLWTSSDSSVAAVDGTGKVTAKSSGTAVITSYKNGDVHAVTISVK